jgi:hypothetical protein
MIPLINYVRTATNKRLLISESRSDSNRCTPYRGKLDTHNTYAFRTSPRTALIHFRRAVPIRDNLSCWPNRIRQINCSREKVLSTPLLSSVKWPMGPASVSLPNRTNEAVHLAKHLLRNRLHRFIGLISPACDQYCWGLVPRVPRDIDYDPTL